MTADSFMLDVNDAVLNALTSNQTNMTPIVNGVQTTGVLDFIPPQVFPPVIALGETTETYEEFMGDTNGNNGVWTVTSNVICFSKAQGRAECITMLKGVEPLLQTLTMARGTLLRPPIMTKRAFQVHIFGAKTVAEELRSARVEIQVLLTK
jgi:hypothetical protein